MHEAKRWQANNLVELMWGHLLDLSTREEKQWRANNWSGNEV